MITKFVCRFLMAEIVVLMGFDIRQASILNFNAQLSCV